MKNALILSRAVLFALSLLAGPQTQLFAMLPSRTVGLNTNKPLPPLPDSPVTPDLQRRVKNFGTPNAVNPMQPVYEESDGSSSNDDAPTASAAPAKPSTPPAAKYPPLPPSTKNLASPDQGADQSSPRDTLSATAKVLIFENEQPKTLPSSTTTDTTWLPDSFAPVLDHWLTNPQTNTDYCWSNGVTLVLLPGLALVWTVAADGWTKGLVVTKTMEKRSFGTKLKNSISAVFTWKCYAQKGREYWETLRPNPLTRSQLLDEKPLGFFGRSKKIMRANKILTLAGLIATINLARTGYAYRQECMALLSPKSIIGSGADTVSVEGDADTKSTTTPPQPRGRSATRDQTHSRRTDSDGSPRKKRSSNRAPHTSPHSLGSTLQGLPEQAARLSPAHPATQQRSTGKPPLHQSGRSASPHTTPKPSRYPALPMSPPARAVASSTLNPALPPLPASPPTN